MAMELRVGNKYRLGRKIGSGSFGDIYLGKRRKKEKVEVAKWHFGCDQCVVFVMLFCFIFLLSM
jgi:serine/threonine protein kinase